MTDHHTAIHNELTNEPGELSKEETVQLATKLMSLSHSLLANVTADEDYVANVMKMLEIIVLLSRDVNKEHELEHGEDEHPESEAVHEEVEKLAFAVIEDNQVDRVVYWSTFQIDEDFSPKATFDTLVDAIEFAELHENVLVVRVDWDKETYKLGLVKELV